MLLDGHTASSVCERLGLSGTNLLYRWKREILREEGGIASNLEGRVRELESELRQLERERDGGSIVEFSGSLQTDDFLGIRFRFPWIKTTALPVRGLTHCPEQDATGGGSLREVPGTGSRRTAGRAQYGACTTPAGSGGTDGVIVSSVQPVDCCSAAACGGHRTPCPGNPGRKVLEKRVRGRWTHRPRN